MLGSCSKSKMKISTDVRLRLWVVLALALVLVVVTWLWLRGKWLAGDSPLSVPQFESPLPTPVSSRSALPSGGGVALLWVALGIVLTLLIALVIVYWPRRA